MTKAAFVALMEKMVDSSRHVDSTFPERDVREARSSYMVDLASGKHRFDKRLSIEKLIPRDDYVSIHIDVSRACLGYLKSQKFRSAILHVPYRSILGVVEYSIAYPAGDHPYFIVVVDHALVAEFLPDDESRDDEAARA